MLLIDNDLRRLGIKKKVHLLLQVHDELVYEAQDDIADQATMVITSAMMAVFERSPIPTGKQPVRLSVSISTGSTLADLK